MQAGTVSESADRFFPFQRELVSTKAKMTVWYGHHLSSSESNNFPISSGRN
jgi:hypothetical protein